MNNRKAITGVAVVVGITVASGTGYALATGSKSPDGTGFCAQMPDAVGLYPGNPVTQMGYRVGKIEQVQPEGDHVQVTFSLKGDRRYPADVKAVTRSKSLLADRSLELVGNYAAGPELTAGRCIALDHSFTPKSISEIAGSAADFIDAMSPSDGKQSFQQAVAGFDDALRGNGPNVDALMRHAAAAMSAPDQLIADMGSSIRNMAPLTEEALQRWATIRSILDQASTAIRAAAYGLLPGLTDVANGLSWVVNVLYRIQRNYGDLIWPLMHGGVTDVIHLAATRSKDIAALLESIPSIAAVLRQQSDGAGGLTMVYQPPTVELDSAAAPQICDVLNSAIEGSCTPDGTSVKVAGLRLFDLVLAKGDR
ncbi:MlaD family protein [Nocardia sp. R6R-6]|uniref:MlaD family protein n=1 Tax=Nocardia sp. R6R-6 TaxID=3459303 RepID=UPI00403DE90D